MADRALATIPERERQIEAQAPALAGQLIPLFPDDLNEEQALQLARVSLIYELDPLMGELIPYQGKPFVTFDGYLRIAGREPMYDGFDHRPATEEERKGLGAQDGEVIWVGFVYRKDRSRPAKAFGRAGGRDERNPLVSGKNRKNTVYVTPYDQALTRSLRRALRASFSLKLPGGDGEGVSAGQLRALHAVDDRAGVDRDQRHAELRETYGVEASNEMTGAQASAYIDGRLIDLESGEVIDGEPPEGAPGDDLSIEAELADLIAWIDGCDDRAELNRDIRAAITDLDISNDQKQVVWKAFHTRLKALS